LQAAADSAKVYQRRLWQAAEQASLAAVSAAGVEIIRPDKAAFAERTRPLLEAYRSHPTIYPLIRQIQELP
jgi:TRAP-type C4-dicarboxylate transport system substrate-binding protein